MNSIQGSAGVKTTPNVQSTIAPQAGRTRLLRDSQAIASTISFFPAAGSGDARKENYGQNAIPGDVGLTIREIGFQFNALGLHFDGADADTNLIAISSFFNNLAGGYVEFHKGTGGGAQCDHEKLLLQDFLAFDYSMPSDAAADMLVLLHNRPLIKLPQPVVLGSNEPFTAKVTLNSTTGLAHADLNVPGAPGAALEMILTIGATETPKALAANAVAVDNALRSGAGRIVVAGAQNAPSGVGDLDRKVMAN